MKQPISIVIPVYNSQKYLKETINSVIKQTFTHWELLIIDGGSTDNTASIVHSYTDTRIKYIPTKKYLDIVDATNKGIHSASGKYIALLDSDNIMHKNRLLLQYLFLEKNQDISLVGSWVQKIDQNSTFTHHIFRPYISYELIRIKLLFGNCISQPSVMIRKSVIQKYKYRSLYKEASDYDLWTRICSKYRIANMPKVLTYYRVHDSNRSTQYDVKKSYIFLDKKIIKNQFTKIEFHLSNSELEKQFGLEKKQSFSQNSLKEYEKWLIKLYIFNLENKKFDIKMFNYIIHSYWFRICCLAAQNGIAAYTIYSNSKISKLTNNKLRMKTLLYILCIFHINFAFETFSYTWLQLNFRNSIKSYLRFFLFSLPIFIGGLTIRKLFIQK